VTDQEQQDVLDAYGLAFFQSAFSGEPSPLLEGRAVLPRVRRDLVEVSFARDNALVVDDFEAPGLGRNRLGQRNSWSNLLVQEVVFAGSALDRDAAYPGGALFSVPEAPNGTTSYSFEGLTRGIVISGGTGLFRLSLGGPTNLVGMEVSLRAAALARDPHLPANVVPPGREPSGEFDLGLVSRWAFGATTTSWVGSAQVGGVSVPYRKRAPPWSGGQTWWYARSVLKTLIFPVSCFSTMSPLFDPRHVVEIVLRPRNAQAYIAFDDICLQAGPRRERP
jgi:hypothetical protein